VSSRGKIQKIVRKSNKQLVEPSSENLDTRDFVEKMASGEEGATHDGMVKTPMTWKRFHNMGLDLSLQDLQGPIHEALDLSTSFLIQLLILAFHLSWPILVHAKASSSL